MANMCVAGEAFVKVDGRQLSVRGTLTISPNTITRTPVAGLDGIHGYSSVFRAPYIEVEITNRAAQFPLTDLVDVVDATVTAELETGEVWVLRDAWQSGDLELNAADGTCTVHFDGLDMRRQMSAAA
jgi:hypothetical protein